MRKRTDLFEAFIKQTQKVSDLDLFLKQFSKVIFFQTFEEMEDGLSTYASINYGDAYVFPFTS